MAETHHLQQRGDTWYFVRRVPRHLVPVIGKTFVKKSLGTPDLKVAKAKRNAQDVAADALFAGAEAALSGRAAGAPGPVSMAVLTEHLRAHIATADEKSARRLAADPPENEAQKADMKMDAEIVLGILKSRDDPRAEEWIDATTDKVLASTGSSLTDREIVTSFAEVVRRGLMELQHRKLDRYDERYGRAFHDELFDPARAPAVTFAGLVEIFLAEKMKDYAANGISEKSADRIKAAAAYLVEEIGATTPVHSVDDDMIQRARESIAATPGNRNKVYPGLPLVNQIAKAEKDGKPLMSAHTQGFYLDTLRDVMKVAVRKRFLPYNPADDAKPLKRETLSPEEKRLPWTPDQLQGFFCGKFYRSCAPEAIRPYSKPDRPWRFWLPLLMLFSGARPGELLQLETGDIRQTDAGTWFFDLMNEDDSKKLKTATSRRRVPIHSELIRLGFLHFVQQRKKEAKGTGPRLFHNVVPDKYGSLTDRPSKSFNRTFIPAEIELTDRQALYSLRHNVRDALRRIKAPPALWDKFVTAAPRLRTLSEQQYVSAAPTPPSSALPDEASSAAVATNPICVRVPRLVIDAIGRVPSPGPATDEPVLTAVADPEAPPVPMFMVLVVPVVVTPVPIPYPLRRQPPVWRGVGSVIARATASPPARPAGHHAG